LFFVGESKRERCQPQNIQQKNTAFPCKKIKIQFYPGIDGTLIKARAQNRLMEAKVGTDRSIGRIRSSTGGNGIQSTSVVKQTTCRWTAISAAVQPATIYHRLYPRQQIKPDQNLWKGKAEISFDMQPRDSQTALDTYLCLKTPFIPMAVMAGSRHQPWMNCRRGLIFLIPSEMDRRVKRTPLLDLHFPTGVTG